MTTARRPKPPAPTTAAEAALLAELAPRLERLAEDVWVLAQRAPGVLAEPALREEAGRLLAAARRGRGRAPGHRLLPRNFPPGIGLAALALSLRQLQVAVARAVARQAPPPGPGTGEVVAATNRLTALVLRDVAGDLARRRGLALPADLRDSPPA